MNLLILLLYAAPVALAVVAALGLSEPGLRPRRVLRAGRLATLFALTLALGSIGFVALHGPATSPVIGVRGIGLAVRLDMLSAILFTLVAFVGVIVVQFSRNYMDGDARQGTFFAGLCLTLAAVMMLVLSGNLVQLILAWMATSVSLHRLLVFYRERPAAVLAARKKFITARLGDACLVVAAALLVKAFGTFDIASLLEQARLTQSTGIIPAGVPYAAVLLAVAALLKSAQFPTHGWLLEVMETPTPVSALLHAGIINAGGFLIVRFADVMVLFSPSLHLLAIVGGFTALFGAIVMLTQTSVKVSLAWSTIAQMGFMLLQCGLGVFPIAVLHIVAHSVYKAHAFLSSGSVVESARASRIPATREALRMGRVAGILGLALVIVGLVGALLGVSPAHDPAVLAFGAIFVLGLGQFMFSAARLGKGTPNEWQLVLGTSVAAILLSGVYFALQHAADLVLAGTLPAPLPPDPVTIAIMLLAVASFASITLLQLSGPAAKSAAWQRAYVHLSNGLYANSLFNRFAGALKRRAGTAISREIA